MSRFNSTKKVPEQGLLQRLPEFFGEIRNISRNYDYIAATERRCFNLVARFLPELNMVSGSALKLCCGDMAEHYRKHFRLPRVLIIDDIMVRGRSISKLLLQLEVLLEEELSDVLITPEDSFRFRSSFTDAVDIYVYAKNRGTLFLGERFQRKLRFMMELYAGRLRDLSLQMSYWLARQEIANTSFVCSVRSKLLTDLLQKEDAGAECEWKKIVWKHPNEEMILYTRIYGEDQVNRISTLRFFPGRANKQPPQMTSFTLIGELNTQEFANLCKELAQVLQKMECHKLSAIFKNEKSVIRINQGQLLCFILSILDLFEFCQSILTEEQYLQVEDELRMDLNKIACQFGPREEMRKELAHISGSVFLRWRLKQIVSEWLAKHATPIVPLELALCKSGKTNYGAGEMDTINENSERLFYRIGWQGEARAAQINQEPDQFRPERYQNYEQVSEYGDHGIISLYDYFELCQKETPLLQNRFYGYLSAFIYMMDSGIMSVRVNVFSQNGEAEKISLMSKAGELSSFYVPRKLALLVPALAQIESYSFALGAEAKTKEALEFIEAMQKICALTHLSGFSEEEMRDLREKSLPELLPENLREDIYNLYRCGQSFRGWDFPSLTAMEKQVCEKFQLFLNQNISMFRSGRMGETPFTAI